MGLRTYYRNSLAYHWRMHLTVVLGVAVATATLTGALLVGDSMRGSLREMALRRLGLVDHALVGRRFFREPLAGEIAGSAEFRSRFGEACPVILTVGSVSHASTQARANRIHVLGVDDRFWSLDSQAPTVGGAGASGGRGVSDRSVILNAPLAAELGAAVGDDVLIRLAKRDAVPVETLLGRRDDRTVALRMTVGKVVAAEGLGGFGVRARQSVPRNAFVPLAALQRVVKQPGRVNAILVTGAGGANDVGEAVEDNGILQGILKAEARLADFGLRLRRDPQRGYVSLESDRLLIEPPVEAAALDAAEAVGAAACAVLTYLANDILRIGDFELGIADCGLRIAASDGNPQLSIVNPQSSVVPPQADQSSIPYSTVTAIDFGTIPASARFILTDGRPAPRLERQDILLNAWAADDLGAKVGDCIELSYYVSRPFGRLETVETTFVLRGIVRMEGWAGDPGMTPQYEGITDAANLSDWDPPFPIDMRRIRDEDERYWDAHRATPKAFVSLQAGQALWAASAARFGRLTAIRIVGAAGTDLDATAAAFEAALLDRLAPEQSGLAFEPVKQEALAASLGGTDFGGLFIGFSMFLIASAAMLVALVFRLGVERRAAEIGTLLATGFAPRRITRMMMTEGALVAGLGTAVGLAGAAGYAWLMLAGLRSWWAQAVRGPLLELHAAPSSYAIGFAASLAVALLSIAWAIRGLSRSSPRALLAGVVRSGRPVSSMQKRRIVTGVAVGSLVIAVVLVMLSLATGVVPQTGAFFGSGAALLVACLAGLWVWTARDPRAVIHRPGTVAMARLGLRNAIRNRGRSLLTVGLIASAAFVIVAVGANRHGADADAEAKASPAGGFALIAEAAIPLQHDLNTAAGRDALDLADGTADLLGNGAVMAFRLKGGDDASCLNLYKVGRPRILGATEAMIDRGGFVFAASLAETPAEQANPWTLLRRTFDDGAVPAIGDDNTVKWLLHLGLGKDLAMIDERGRPVRLRIVGTLAGSVLQGELVIAESRFVDLFPSVGWYGVFLIESARADARRLGQALERDLSIYGLDAALARERLAEYLAVENTYLSTFQTLGGLGLLLGTLGLAAVMLRNVLERRGELALLRAVGYRQSALGWLVLTENVALLMLGLAAGSVSALVAVAPHAASSPGDIPWLSLGGTLLAVLAAGMTAGAAALVATLRAPLLPALRTE